MFVLPGRRIKKYTLVHLTSTVLEMSEECISHQFCILEILREMRILLHVFLVWTACFQVCPLKSPGVSYQLRPAFVLQGINDATPASSS